MTRAGRKVNQGVQMESVYTRGIHLVAPPLVLEKLFEDYPWMEAELGCKFLHRSAASTSLVWRCETGF